MLEVRPPLTPMEARAVEHLPAGPEWQYEPKWDGFRCLAFRDGGAVDLRSKSGQPLARYFPELVSALREVPAERFALDGEIVVPVGGRLSFDQLLQRVHPAESRVRRLAAEHPALLVVFDLLGDERGRSLLGMNLAERRALLRGFASRFLVGNGALRLSPATTDASVARRWFKRAGGALDGVIAKRLDMPYRAGARDGMLKIKHRRTADCVVGGFRLGAGTRTVGSLLLGLYDRAGLLHHVGFTSTIKRSERERVTGLLWRLRAAPGFTGRAPGGPSRWSRRTDDRWEPVRPEMVVEVEYDHFTGHRFRHGTRLARWRPDKAPRQCTMDQVERPDGGLLGLLRSRAPRVRGAAKAREGPERAPVKAAGRTGAARAVQHSNKEPEMFRKYAYIWITLGLFALSLAGHWIFGWRAYLGEAQAHGQPAELGAYLIQMSRDTLENWQSEFLQLVWQVAGLKLLLCVGSPQSKEQGERLEAKIDFLMSSVEGGASKLKALDARHHRR